MYRLVTVLLIVSAAAVLGDEEGIQALIAKTFNKCKEQFPITDEEMQKIRDKETVPDSPNAKCIMACLLKEGKIESLTAVFTNIGKVTLKMKDGKYFAENALLMVDILHKNEPEIVAKAKQLIEHCAGEVGSDATPDECEFAYKMALCASAEAKKLGVHPPEF